MNKLKKWLGLEWRKWLKNINEVDKKERQMRAVRLRVFEEWVNPDQTFLPLHGKTLFYLKEAKDAFVYALFKSCITSCTTAVDITFKDEYRKYSINQTNKTLIEKGETATFGKVIGWCQVERIQSVQNVIERAELLNRLRNFIIHPLVIPDDDAQAEKIIEMLEYEYDKFSYILKNTHKGQFEKFTDLQTIGEDEKGKITSISIRDLIKKYKNKDNLFTTKLMWDAILESYTYGLSIVALRLSKEIFEGIDYTGQRTYRTAPSS